MWMAKIKFGQSNKVISSKNQPFDFSHETVTKMFTAVLPV